MLIEGLKHGRWLRTRKGSTDPEGPRTRFQEVEEILGTMAWSLSALLCARCRRIVTKTWFWLPVKLLFQYVLGGRENNDPCPQDVCV